MKGGENKMKKIKKVQNISEEAEKLFKDITASEKYISGQKAFVYFYHIEAACFTLFEFDEVMKDLNLKILLLKELLNAKVISNYIVKTKPPQDFEFVITL